MAKKLNKQLKLQIKGGQANPAPPLGPALGQAGVNIGEFVNQFNDATKDKMGETVSVLLNCYEDRSFDFVIKTAPVSAMIKKALNIKSGSGKNRVKKVGTLTQDQVRAIAEEKLPDLNARDVEAAMKIVAGTARSMGVEVK
jgi:large subunit ribosomal protein L11